MFKVGSNSGVIDGMILSGNGINGDNGINNLIHGGGLDGDGINGDDGINGNVTHAGLHGSGGADSRRNS